MRRKMIALAVLVMLPAAVFADWGFGGALSYKSPALLGQSSDVGKLEVDQFSFGGDARYTSGFFQAEALLLGSVGSVSSFNTYGDLGGVLDIAIVRLSLGAGPNITCNFGTSPVVQAGLNARISTDVIVRPISVGLFYVAAVDVNRSGVSSRAGLLGISVLYWM